MTIDPKKHNMTDADITKVTTRVARDMMRTFLLILKGTHPQDHKELNSLTRSQLSTVRLHIGSSETQEPKDDIPSLLKRLRNPDPTTLALFKQFKQENLLARTECTLQRRFFCLWQQKANETLLAARANAKKAKELATITTVHTCEPAPRLLQTWSRSEHA